MECAQMDRLLRDFISMPNGPKGCACLCAQGYARTYTGLMGYADILRQTPINERSLFRIMSLTKLIVVTAALTLFEQGKFLMEEPLSRYLPEYALPQKYVLRPGGWHTEPARVQPLVRHAFTMTYGLPYDIANHPVSKMMLEREQILIKEKGIHYDILSEVRAMGEIPVVFEAGTRWLYGYGLDIIAALIAVWSGMPTYEYIKKAVLEPIGMRDTAYRFRNDDERARLVTIYCEDKNGCFVPGQGPRDSFHEPDANFDMGAAGLFSSPADYLAFTQVLANGGQTKDGKRILSRNTIDMMRTNQLEGEALADFKADGNNLSYGYGYGVRTRMPGPTDNNETVGAFGWSGMCGSWASIDPVNGFSVVYMHQLLPDLQFTCHPRVRTVAYADILKR